MRVRFLLGGGAAGARAGADTSECWLRSASVSLSTIPLWELEESEESEARSSSMSAAHLLEVRSRLDERRAVTSSMGREEPWPGRAVEEEAVGSKGSDGGW